MSLPEARAPQQPSPRQQHPWPRVDERVLGAGTSVRFAMLLFLLLAASGSMMLTVIIGLSDGDRAGCELAAGVDPDDSGFWGPAVSTTGQIHAFRYCESLWAPAPSWWQIAAWPALLAVSAALLFRLLPLWKARRGRVVPLEAADPDGELRPLLAELAATAGLSAMPRVVVDPAAGSTGAVVFGRTRRPVVCLDGGLLVTRHRDPVRFRTVLLHELAHIANRDITLTYATVAVWRVFLVLVLLPYLLLQGYWVHEALEAGNVPSLDRKVLLAAFMVALVHLARSDTLRSREVYADLTALRWGADPHGWAGDGPRDAAGPLRRALAPILEQWRTHPRLGLRQGALSDPAPLFRAASLPFFLTGAAAVLAAVHLLFHFAPYYIASSGVYLAASLVPAALVAGVAGIALWRAVAYAVLTGARVPSGIAAGAWMGAGMTAGTLLTGMGAGSAWLPERPYVLLLPVAVGAAFAWWITQCAHLWARTWRGRTLRPALLLGLGAVFLALASWFVWWQLGGAAYAGGYSMRAEGVAQWLVGRFPTTAPVRELVGAPGLTTLLPVLDTFGGTPLVALAATVLWVVPLAAWAVGPGTGALRWTPASAPVPVPAPVDPVPALRRVLLPGLLCGALACVALVAVQVYMHGGQPGPDARGGLYAVRYAGWTLLALAVPSALAATAAGVAAGRFGLIGCLVAAQTATLLGFAGTTALVSLDGCVEALSVFQDGCAWRPAWQVGLFPYVQLLNIASVVATLVAGAVAVGVAVVCRVRPPRSRVPRRAARPGGVAARAAVVRWRLVAGLLCTLAAGTSAIVGAVHLRVLSAVDLTVTQRVTTQLAGVPDRPVPAGTRVRQVHAWYHLSGDGLVELATTYTIRLNAALRGVRKGDSWDSLDRRLRPVCADWGRAEVFEMIWFRVPDRSAQADWHALGAWAGQGSRRCLQGLDARDVPAVMEALRELDAAGRCAATANARIDTVLREGGRAGTFRPPAKGITCNRLVQP
ncbi:Zn-dependent protease with chaperone function [Streptomyces pristinaespiralis]